MFTKLITEKLLEKCGVSSGNFPQQAYFSSRLLSGDSLGVVFCCVAQIGCTFATPLPRLQPAERMTREVTIAATLLTFLNKESKSSKDELFPQAAVLGRSSYDAPRPKRRWLALDKVRFFCCWSRGRKSSNGVRMVRLRIMFMSLIFLKRDQPCELYRVWLTSLKLTGFY